MLGFTILLASTYVTLYSQETSQGSVIKIAPQDGVLAKEDLEKQEEEADQGI